jgi:predicted kinase
VWWVKLGSEVKGIWNVVLSGYPRSGKTVLAKKLVSDHQYFARVGVDELRDMLFATVCPCRDEFLVYSLIAEIRDALLERGYSVVVDSTAPDNISRAFLLTTEVKHVNRLLVVINVDRDCLIRRNVEKFGDASCVFAWDKRWENPRRNIPIFKFRNNDAEEFDSYYARLNELLESEMHPFKPEFHFAQPLKEIRKALQNFLKAPSQAIVSRRGK